MHRTYRASGRAKLQQTQYLRPQGRTTVQPLDSDIDLHSDLVNFRANATREYHKCLTGLTKGEQLRGFVPVLQSESMKRTAADLQRDIKQLKERLPEHLQGAIGRLSGLKKEELEDLWLHLSHLIEEYEDVVAAEADNDEEDSDDEENQGNA